MLAVVLSLVIWLIRKSSKPQAQRTNDCQTQWILYGSPRSGCESKRIELSAVYTWTNGSDPVYSATREQYIRQSNRWAYIVDRMKLERTSKHQREHGELSRSIVQLQKVLSLQAVFVVCSDFLLNGSSYLVQPTATIAGVEFIATRLLMPTHILPVFNSLSIESFLHNIPGLSNEVLYLNDDMILCQTHETSDFFDPLTGPHFHISSDILVHDAVLSEEDEKWDSEWSSLEYTNLLLSRRFGHRARGYVEHISKTFSRDIMAEVARSFEAEITASAAQRFREYRQINMLFLCTWYTIEMSRSSLLELLSAHSQSVPMGSMTDRSLSTTLLTQSLVIAKVQPPRQSRFVWSFLDGYPVQYTSMSSTACASGTQDLNGSCSVADTASVSQVRKILNSLEFDERAEAVKQITRYAYSITETSFEFLNFRSPRDAEIASNRFSAPEDRPAQLCVNEDIKSSDRGQYMEAGLAIVNLFETFTQD